MADGATPRRATVTTMAGLEGSCKVPGAPVSSKASLSVQKVLGVQQRWDIPPPLLIERPAAAPALFIALAFTTRTPTSPFTRAW
jgi:hypothetical protein